jgi:hypothetical protein
MGRYKTNLVEPEQHTSGIWRWLLIAGIVLLLVWGGVFFSKAFINHFKSPGQSILRSLSGLMGRVISHPDTAAADTANYDIPPIKDNPPAEEQPQTQQEPPATAPDIADESTPEPAPDKNANPKDAPKKTAPSNDPAAVQELNGFHMTGVTIERNADPTVFLKKNNSTRGYKIGDKIDDYTIVEIHRYHIVLEKRNGQRVRLEL